MHKLSQRNRSVYRGAFLLTTVLLAVTALGQCGCTTSLAEWYHNGFKVGPNYRKPPVYVAHEWIDAGKSTVRLGEPNLAGWWKVFDDPILEGLIHRAYAGNISLRAAGFRVLQARTQLALAVGELLPQTQTLDASYTRSETTADRGGGGGGIKRFFSTWATSLNLAWEIDFWGKFRRAVESADAALDASVEDYDEALVILLSDVATAYVQYRTLEQRILLAKANVTEQEKSEKVSEAQYKEGKIKLGYNQLKANLHQTESLVPQLESSLRQVNNLLCTLLGIPPRDLRPLLDEGLETDAKGQKIFKIPLPPFKRDRDGKILRDKYKIEYFEEIEVGIPGQLLLRRPDVQKAERLVKAQSAQIGIAEAEFYPHFSIIGNIGLSADRLGKLFDARSWNGNIGPSMTWNILNYGRILSSVRFEDAKFQELVALYQNSILTANQEAENALVGYLDGVLRAKFLKLSAEAAVEEANILNVQLDAGKVDATATFTIQNFKTVQQDAAAQAEGDISLNLIALYRALGGGWQIRLPDAKKRGQCVIHPVDPDMPLAPLKSGPGELPLPHEVPPAKIDLSQPKTAEAEKAVPLSPAVLGVPQQVPALIELPAEK